MQSSYTRFAAMIATSTVLMYALTYLNTYRIDHVFWSETRFFMALLMGAMMSVVMLAYMHHMYERRGVNAAIAAASVLVFFVALYLVRSQTTVGDVAYMRAMIPHHSIAILTSDRARVADPRVRALADRIIESQTKEIDEMKNLIAALQSDAVDGERAAAAR
jgi:predicted PurR-regulated permease PerM